MVEQDADALALQAARERMIQKRFGGQVPKAGGMRRKKKAAHKTASSDDKKIVSTLKRLNVSTIPAIEEVNMFKDNGEVVHFTNPKVQAQVSANTFVISGHSDMKKLQDLLPGIINEMGAENLASLKEIVTSYDPASGHGSAVEELGVDDDDIPDLVENFEETSKNVS
eukprot:368028_1